MTAYEILPTLAEALPTIIIGAGVVGLLSLARVWMKSARRARRCAATLAYLREAQEPPIPPVNQYRPVAVEGSRLALHLGGLVQKLERVVTHVGDENLDAAGHEAKRALIHAKGIQAEYAPPKSVTALRA